MGSLTTIERKATPPESRLEFVSVSKSTLVRSGTWREPSQGYRHDRTGWGEKRLLLLGLSGAVCRPTWP
jgi:hypothetical protein